MKFLITSSPGLEQENAKEIEELTTQKSELLPGGVLQIESEMESVYKILCASRLSSRVLMPLAEFYAWEKEVLYTETKKISWEHLVAEGETIVCDVHGKADNCDYSLAQGLLKIKDAIVDRIREKRGSRPDIDKDNPTHQIEIFIWKGKAQISIDLCGEPLHRRGYRKLHGPAPLRESRAAALVRLSGIEKNPVETLFDPFCGLGTIAIEAALALRKIPAANKRYIPRKNFIPNFHQDYLATLNEYRSQALDQSPTLIIASDIDSSIIPRAKKAAESAGVLRDIRFEVKGFEEQDFQTGSPAALISNLPYGERLEDAQEARQICRALGKKVKFESKIERMCLLVPKGMENDPGLKPSHKSQWKAAELDLVAATYQVWRKT